MATVDDPWWPASTVAQTWVQWNNALYTPSTITGGGGLFYPQTVVSNAAATGAAVWGSWVQAQEAVFDAALALSQTMHRAADPTPDQNRAYRLDAAKRELNRQRSVRRARRLLEEILSPEQREQFKAHGFFLVKSGETTYRINRGKTHNVYVIDANGNAIENLCIVPDDYNDVPEEDCMIAQKLLVEADHDSFRRIANICRGAYGRAMESVSRPPTARDWLRLRPARARRAA